MGRLRDVALTLLVTIPVGVGVAVLRPPLTLTPLLVGVGGALALEAVLLSYRTQVRALWDNWTIQAVAVTVALGVVALAVATVGSTVLLVVLSGAVTYLSVVFFVELRERLTERQ
ncbi:hypothetical protein [Haloferax sp. DFSO52]|uniref:hypothetical protein n=1 Tax=Haloferax sp. DFSO52 TaxID=3388505 RepID=UPI003A8C6877